MKYIIALLFVSSTCFSQSIDYKKFTQYEEEKKDKGTGYLLSSILPGAGLMYAEDNNGVIFLVGGVGTAVLAVSAKGSKKTTPLIFHVLLRVYEFAAIRQSVDDYNRDFRLKLFLGNDALGHVTPSAGVSIGL